MTNIDLKQAAALLMLGIAVGCALSHFYFVDFIDDRAADGVPISVGGHLYEVRHVDPKELFGMCMDPPPPVKHK